MRGGSERIPLRRDLFLEVFLCAKHRTMSWEFKDGTAPFPTLTSGGISMGVTR